MSELDALYQELILDHAKHPRGRGFDEGWMDAAASHQRNPICGDEITLRVRVSGDRIAEVAWEGAGCSISQASASMLAELAPGLAREDALALVADFREALRSRGAIALDEDVFGDASALSGVSKYTARVKCAMLAWVALEDLLGRS